MLPSQDVSKSGLDSVSNEPSDLSDGSFIESQEIFDTTIDNFILLIKGPQYFRVHETNDAKNIIYLRSRGILAVNFSVAKKFYENNIKTFFRICHKMNYRDELKEKQRRRISRKQCNSIFAVSCLYLNRIITNINEQVFSSFTWGQCIRIKHMVCSEQCAVNLFCGAFFLALIYADCDVYETQIKKQYEALEKAGIIRPFAASDVLHFIDALLAIIDFDLSVPLGQLDIILKQLT